MPPSLGHSANVCVAKLLLGFFVRDPNHEFWGSINVKWISHCDGFSSALLTVGVIHHDPCVSTWALKKISGKIEVRRCSKCREERAQLRLGNVCPMGRRIVYLVAKMIVTN